MKNNLERFRLRMRRAAEGLRRRCDALTQQQRRWAAAGLLLVLLVLNVLTTLYDLTSGREPIHGRIEHLHPVHLVTDTTATTATNFTGYDNDTSR